VIGICEEQLERILSSPAFAQSQRIARFTIRGGGSAQEQSGQYQEYI
jgi:hypothetical protein